MPESSVVDISQKIENVLNARKSNLPAIEKRLEKWKILDETIGVFEQGVEGLISYIGKKGGYDEIVQLFKGCSLNNSKKYIRENISTLERLGERMGRETINIGVSGQARVGKSTLLQTIAGLTDEQVPTGSGVPVTAVRSQIFHSDTKEIAIVSFHNFSSFRENILVPFHKDLNLESPPLSSEEYEYFTLSVDNDRLRGFSNTEQVLFSILKNIKASFSSYKHLLDGSVREVGLDEIRPYISYPTQKEEEEFKNKCLRYYLAVKDVKIYAKFPKLQVKKVGMIDLPGLGELTSGAEEHHVQGLRNEVDFVVLVKRPVEGMAYWRKEDASALDVLDRARGAVDRKDFVSIFANTGGASEELLGAMLKDIFDKANEGVEDRNYQVFIGDSKEPDSAYSDLLFPVLEHLAIKLPQMDRKLLDMAQQGSLQNLKIIRSEILNFMAILNGSFPVPASIDEVLSDLTKNMRQSIAKKLKALLADLSNKATNDSADEQYFQALDSVKKNILKWASQDEGLGLGMAAWLDDATGRMAEAKGSAGLIESEFNRIRVHISEQFTTIDVYFQKKIDGLLNEIGLVLKNGMGSLFEEIDNGKQVVQKMYSFVELSVEPCPGWAKAINELLELEIRYRTHLHPRVRKCLVHLDYKSYKDLVFEDNEEGARKLFTFLSNKATQAANEVEKALGGEYKFSDQVLYTACEQFDDSLIRSGTSEKEFGRFARGYKSDIWPEQFADLDMKNRFVSRVSQAETEINNIIDQLEAV
jgi:hypothetical protein